MPTRPYESNAAASYIAELSAAKGKATSIQQVEIVRTHPEGSKPLGRFINGCITSALSFFLVWWFFAAWFPELGITYWQIILPVVAVRAVIGRRPFAKAPKSALEKWLDKKKEKQSEAK